MATPMTSRQWNGEYKGDIPAIAKSPMIPIMVLKALTVMIGRMHLKSHTQLYHLEKAPMTLSIGRTLDRLLDIGLMSLVNG